MNEIITACTNSSFGPAKLNEKYKSLEPADLKAVYALNMCTVSISQILDYNDVYILEQEYDAILNNLNLEAMPKDEALRNILTELLNVITFFRIQEAKKVQIEKKYQRRVKDAIWAAIPNFSVITPVSIGSVGKDAMKTLLKANVAGAVTSIVTQVGTGYMNYRREKANARRDKENDDFELQITAIEQFNALQRELFTTAWKLAENHTYYDELRLTERQIKQYNQILMDPDDYRKCARLEAIQESFIAYPPFWYMLAHTELSIAQSDTDENVRKEYRKKAKDCLQWCCEAFCFAPDGEEANHHYGILREDHMAAAALLEYADLLLSEGKPDDYEKIYKLIQEAEKKAGQANDILQLCAIGYLNIRKTDDAEKLLKFLVNEGYSTISNARILSWIYACDRIHPGASKADVHRIEADYELLSRSVRSDCLFPLPTETENFDDLNTKYIGSFKEKLIVAYRVALTQFESRMGDSFDIVPQYSTLSKNSLADCHAQLKNDYVALMALSALNETVSALDTLAVFKGLEKRNEIIYNITGKLKCRAAKLRELKEKGTESFDGCSYNELLNNFSYYALADSFYICAKNHIMEAIQNVKDENILQQLSIFENDLIEFCIRNCLKQPDYLLLQREHQVSGKQVEYFDEKLLDISRGSVESRKKMTNEITKSKDKLVVDQEKAAVYLQDSNEFNEYFENKKLEGEKDTAKNKALAVIDDKTRKNYDLLLCDDGIMVVESNRIMEGTVRYNSVYCRSEEDGNSKLMIYYPVEYQNKSVNVEHLYELVQVLGAISHIENK